MRYHPLAVAKIINSCAVLHNFLTLNGLAGEEFDEEIIEDEHFGDMVDGAYLRHGRIVRDSVVRYFTENNN